MDIKWEKHVGKVLSNTKSDTLLAKGPDGKPRSFTRVGADGTSLVYVSETGRGKNKSTLYLYVRKEEVW